MINKTFIIVFTILVTISFESKATSPIGEVQKVNLVKKEIVVWIKNKNQLLNMNDKLTIIINGKVIQLIVTNPMGTVARCRLSKQNMDKIRQIKKGMLVYKNRKEVEKEISNHNSATERQIILNVNPENAKVYIDGNRIDHKNSEVLQLSEKGSNEYEIELKKWGYDNLKQTFSIKSGEKINLKYYLSRDEKFYFIFDGLSIGTEYNNKEFKYYYSLGGFKTSMHFWGVGVSVSKGQLDRNSILPLEFFIPLFDVDFNNFPILFTLNYEFDWCRLNISDNDTGSATTDWEFSFEHKFKINCFWNYSSIFSSIYAAYAITSEEQKFYVGTSIGFGKMYVLFE